MIGSTASFNASFNTHWVIYPSSGVPGLSAGLASARSIGMSSNQFSNEGCRIFYERHSGFITFLSYAQSHPQVIYVAGAYNYPKYPIVLQYAYTADSTMMALMHTYAPSMTQANPAYGSGSGQSLSNTPYTITGQGLCIVVAFEQLTGLDFMTTILKPTLRAYFASTSEQTPTTTILPTDYTGICDFDYESWYPTENYSVADTTTITWDPLTHADYFLRWCRTGGGHGWASGMDLEASHFTYCPQVTGTPNTSDAAAKALYWATTLRYWTAIKEVMLERAPGAKLGVYGWPPTPSYYDYAVWTPYPTDEINPTQQGKAATAMAAHYAKYTNMSKEGSIIALLDQHEPSWYFHGTTLAPGVPEVQQFPWGTYPAQWSQWQQGKLYHSYAVEARKLADYFNKPLVPYITPTTHLYDNPATTSTNEGDTFGPGIDIESAKLLGRFAVAAGVDGLILWGYYDNAAGNTSQELLDGLPYVQQYIIEPCRAVRKQFASTPSYLA